MGEFVLILITQCLGLNPWFRLLYFTNGSNEMNYNVIDLKVQEAERQMGLEVHHDGFKPVNFLEWWSVVAPAR